MPPKKKSKSNPEEASPAKSVGEELAALQKLLRVTAEAYEKRLQAEIARVAAWNESVAQSDKPSREQMRDQGDMLGLLRKLKLKPEKGRRRDLRKIDSVVEDLVSLCRQKSAD
ncbi:MAG: hypothetical protein ACR2NX_08730 [Chthoniobacterales bacterium]